MIKGCNKVSDTLVTGKLTLRYDDLTANGYALDPAAFGFADICQGSAHDYVTNTPAFLTASDSANGQPAFLSIDEPIADGAVFDVSLVGVPLT